MRKVARAVPTNAAKRSIRAFGLLALLMLPAGCAGALSERAADARADYPNINAVPPVPQQRLMTPEESAGAEAALKAKGAAAEKAAAGGKPGNPAELQQKAATQTKDALKTIETTCRPQPNGAVPKDCPK